MTPTFEDKERGVQLYLGDWRLLKDIIKGYDCIVTDPPYGKGLDYGEMTDDTMEQFRENMMLLHFDGAPVIVTIPSTRLYDLPSKPQWVGVWHKPMTFGFLSTPLIPHWEAIVFWRHEKKIEHTDVFVCNPAKPNGHPCPKPIELMNQLVQLSGWECVLDPFMGSGTTGIACLRTGRRFIGIEIDPTYYKIAEDRIRRELAQGMLPLTHPAS